MQPSTATHCQAEARLGGMKMSKENQRTDFNIYIQAMIHIVYNM